MAQSYRFLFIFAVWILLNNRLVSPQTEPEPEITSPRPGEALQGLVPITGSDNLPGFVSSEIAFAYSSETTSSWFLVATIDHPVIAGMLATWDTASITDGNYILRLRVQLNDGSFRDVTVQNLRVRNYTPVETPTPGPTAIKPTLVPTLTLTATPFPTPTPLPTNQAILTTTDLSMSIGVGGLGAVVLFAVLGIYLWLRRK